MSRYPAQPCPKCGLTWYKWYEGTEIPVNIDEEMIPEYFAYQQPAVVRVFDKSNSKWFCTVCHHEWGALESNPPTQSCKESAKNE